MSIAFTTLNIVAKAICRADLPYGLALTIELGGRYRLVVNEVKAEQPEMATPHLPVAKVLWKPEPNLSDATVAWIYAGGAHHTVLSFTVTTNQLVDFAEMTDIEVVVIDQDLNLRQFKNELKWNDAIFRK